MNYKKDRLRFHSYLSKDKKEELPEEAQEYIDQLERENKKLKEEIDRLTGLLRMNSQNSSKPPSSDQFKKNVIPGSQRRNSDKKPGGQHGHRGSTLKPVSKPDMIINYQVNECAHCERDLSQEKVVDTNYTQVFDLPVIKIHVTEHRSDIKKCPCCHNFTQAALPPGILPVPVQYGANLKGFSLYLMDQQLIPSRRVAEIVSGILGHSFSIGSLLNWQKEGFLKLEEFENKLIAALIASDVVHFDETGMRAMGSRHWLHSSSTKFLSFFGIHKRRGEEAMSEFGVLPFFKGVAIHDHWKAYFTFEDCLHGLCNSHLQRELKFLEEESKELWAKKMSELLTAIHKEVEGLKELGKNALSNTTKLEFIKRYEVILKEGFKFHRHDEVYTRGKRGRVKQSKGKNLLDRFRDFNREILRFMNDFRVPFTNNQSERDIRMNKVKQNISGCFRSITSAKHFCRIRSYFSTARKQGYCILEAAVAIFKNEPLQLTDF